MKIPAATLTVAVSIASAALAAPSVYSAESTLSPVCPSAAGTASPARYTSRRPAYCRAFFTKASKYSLFTQAFHSLIPTTTATQPELPADPRTQWAVSTWAKALTAAREGDTKGHSYLRDKVDRFGHNHLAVWLPPKASRFHPIVLTSANDMDFIQQQLEFESLQDEPRVYFRFDVKQPVPQGDESRDRARHRYEEEMDQLRALQEVLSVCHGGLIYPVVTSLGWPEGQDWSSRWKLHGLAGAGSSPRSSVGSVHI
ncbi:hypothetical protein IWQ60_003630 [Tieghemiomyces parasiticus]|uniref:Uncharacterized protein n=1 Tax=Tieghemiomyces parasiticus TaxID=78921 RepID=A0A9W8E0H8_9FUNG|nr:hypothetical protein IWQ60_003630 [Tieghemiomyces parasiticus]